MLSQVTEKKTQYSNTGCSLLVYCVQMSLLQEIQMADQALWQLGSNHMGKKEGIMLGNRRRCVKHWCVFAYLCICVHVSNYVSEETLIYEKNDICMSFNNILCFKESEQNQKILLTKSYAWCTWNVRNTQKMLMIVTIIRTLNIN